MKEITTYDGKILEINCIGCDAYSDTSDMEHSILYEDECFRIVQDTENPIVGFFVIGAKRHFRTLLDMNPEESKRLMPLIIETRRVMKEVLNINTVTLVQEDSRDTMHFHPWLFPWYSWMEDIEGTGTEKMRAVMKYSRENMNTEDNIKKVNEALVKTKKEFTVKF